MAQERGGPPAKDNRPGGNRPGGERRDGKPGGGRGGPHKGGFGKGSGKPERVETYENVGQVQRGTDFRIEKSVIADKATHKPIRTEYRLYREGLAERQVFPRLADAIAASTAPLPEPEPETETVESASEPAESETAEAAPESEEATTPAEEPAALEG